MTLSAEVLYNFRKSVLELKDRLKEKSMDIICAILTGFHYLVERTKRLAERVKISKKSRREKAVFVIGAIAVAAVDFSFHGVHAAGFYEVYAAVGDEESETETEENSTFGLDSIIEGVYLSQNQDEAERIGTSFEVVLVGQRIGTRELASDLDFGTEGARKVELLREKSIGISEEQLTMSDEDYNTLLKIVEAEAGGEDMKGKILVANVIFNRMKSPEFPSTVTEVVWENVAGSPQFSPTADGRIHTVTVSAETREAVNRAIDGENYSKGALFFVEEEYADKSNVAWFKKDLKFLFQYGVHDFYTYP